MRFYNGHWLLAEGVKRIAAAEVCSVKIGQGRCRVQMPSMKVTGKGDTTSAVIITLDITVPAEDVIHVREFHYSGVADRGPHFDLTFPDAADVPVSMEETEAAVIVRSTHLSLTIGKADASLTYAWDGRVLSRSLFRDICYFKTDYTGETFYYPDSECAWMCQQLTIDVDEYIYGLGERFTPFVKNGQAVKIWNEDGGTSTEQGYKNIPFYLSSKGYGVFVNHTEKVEFEIGTEITTRMSIAVPGEFLDYFFIGGPDMKGAVEKYTDMTGKPGLPPQWTFGLWLSTSFTTNYDEKTVMSFIDGMQQRGIPLDVFHFDCCWLRDFHWCDFVWDEKVFPDPKGLISRIHAKGIKVCVWINPYIGQSSELFEEGAQKGYLLKRENGDVWQWDMWQSGMGIVDFTNPEARAWFKKQLYRLLDEGVDCFKTDFGERIPTDCVYYNGADPVKMHNYYTYLYNQTVTEAIAEKRGPEEAVVFARSATSGGQKFPVHWGGDCSSDYPSMGESIRGGLSLMCSGFGYWSHDISGFESTATPDVYKRWSAFGLLSTHSRLHGSSSYRVPWNFDEESVDVLRSFVKLKLSLLPYIYSGAVKTHRTGLPLMRPVQMEFDEPAVRYLDKEYLLDDNLLVAPIFNDQSMAEYYLPILPEGQVWTNWFTGETAEGGVWRREKHSYFTIPLWVRANAVIATAPGNTSAADDFTGSMELRVYEPAEQTGCEVFCLRQEIMKVGITKTADGYSVSVVGERIPASWTLRFVNRAGLTCTGNGVTAETDGNDTLIRVSGVSSFEVR